MAADGEELARTAREAVDAATAAGVDEAEAWVEGSHGREIRVHGGEVESLTEASERGAGIRAWLGHRAGYAYGTDLSAEGLRELGAAAAGAARAADSDQHAGAPDPDGEPAPIEGLRDPAIGELETAEAIELAKLVERAALERDERISGVEEVVYVDEDGEVALASTRGPGGGFAASQCYAYLQAMAADGDEVQTGLGFGVGRSSRRLDPEAIGWEAADEALSMLGAGKPASRSCPVVLSDRVAASFAGLIGASLCADEVQRGRSPFAERLDEQLASEAITLTDDGIDPEGLASSPFDGEGTPRGRTALIGERRLLAYLHDSYTARRGDSRSTGNAARASYRSPPSVQPSNLVIEPGTASFGQLLAEAADGVYVTEVAGLHSGVNPATGRFSVGATGRAIRGGELAESLREFTVAGELLETLRDIRAVGSESRWVPFGGSVRSSPLLVMEMAIGGS